MSAPATSSGKVNPVEALANEIKALSPPERLRLAADLMERQRGDVAYTIAAPVVEELGAAIALRKIGRIVVESAPGDMCGNTKKLANGTRCPGCRACS